MSSQFRILIVEDDKASSDLLAQVLRHIEATILRAYDGAEALQILEEQRPEIVILDILLPKVNGTIVLQTIYDSPALARTRVLVLSADSSFDPSRLRTGDVFLLKPIPPANLLRVVTQFLSDLSS